MANPLRFNSLWLAIPLLAGWSPSLGHSRQSSAEEALSRAEVAVGMMDEGLLRDFATTAIARERAREGDDLRALKLAQSIERTEERDLALLSLVREQAKRDANAAYITAGRIAQTETRGDALAEAALAFARLGRFQEALRKSEPIEDEGARFSLHCAVAAEMIRQGQPKQAEDLLTDSETVRTILGRWKDRGPEEGPEGLARALFDQKVIVFLLRQKASAPIEFQDVRSSIYDYGYSVESPMQIGEIAGLRDHISDPGSADRLIQTYLDSVDSEAMRDLSVSQIGVGMALIGDTEGALRWAPKCTRPQTRDLVYLAIVTDRAPEGDMERAEGVLKLITTEPAKLGALCEMARLLALTRPALAADYLRRAERDAADAEEADPGRFYLGALASAYAALGQPAEARTMLARLEQAFGNAPTYDPGDLVDLYLACGDDRGATRWAASDLRSFARILERQAARGDISGSKATALAANSAMTLAILHRGPSDEISAVCRAETKYLGPALIASWAKALTSPEAQVYAWVGIAQGMFDRVVRSPDGQILTGSGSSGAPKL